MTPEQSAQERLDRFVEFSGVEADVVLAHRRFIAVFHLPCIDPQCGQKHLIPYVAGVN